MSEKTIARVGIFSWLPFVAPFALFLVLTTVEAYVRPPLYPLLYTVKVVLVGALLTALRRPGGAGRRLRASDVALAVLAGGVLVCAWVLLDRVTPHFALLGSRTGFDPFQQIAGPGARAVFLAVRFVGLVVIVPIVEESFYRGFLLRYVTDMDDFRRAPIGVFSLTAFAVNVALFALSHPEWLVAGIFSAAMCLLLARTKNLGACILAHAVTNLLLGFYILQTHQWQYW